MATGDNKLATFSRGSDEVYSLVCLPCYRDDTTRPAYGYCMNCKEHLCHECFKNHRKPAPLRHHVLQGKDKMPSIQQLTGTPVHAGITDRLTTPCPHHKTEIIKFYCHDHDLLMCSICVTLKHTKPCRVDYIPDVSNNIINSQDYQHIMDKIDKLLKNCTTIKTETSTDANRSNHSLKDALQEIKKYRQEINKRMDELQNEIETKIQALHQQNDEQIKTVETICEDVMKTVNVMYDRMKQLNTSNQADQLFMEVKQAHKLLHDYEQSIKSLSAENGIDEYTFIPNQSINDVLQKEIMIGEILPKHQTMVDFSSQRNIQPGSANDTITPTYLGEICVKSSKDRNRCWSTCMTVLPPNRLVLTDCSNKSIKLVDVNSKSIISQLSLGKNAPFDITTTTSTQVAVTVPVRQHIQILSASNKLSKSHTIQTDGSCTGICCHQDKLVVTYWYPGKLDIMDMRGRVITRVTTDSTGTDIFTKPLSVQANSRSLYVTQTEPDMNIMLNWNGEVTGRNIQYAGGELALLPDGSLLICDGGHDRVCQVAGDGSNSKTVIQDVRGPNAICVDDGGHKLYIGRFTKEDKHDNNILIYNI